MRSHGFRDDKPNEFVSTRRNKRWHPYISGHVGLRTVSVAPRARSSHRSPPRCQQCQSEVDPNWTSDRRVNCVRILPPGRHGRRSGNFAAADVPLSTTRPSSRRTNAHQLRTAICIPWRDMPVPTGRQRPGRGGGHPESPPDLACRPHRRTQSGPSPSGAAFVRREGAGRRRLRQAGRTGGGRQS
jgi:hypothetical protein